MNEIKNGGPAFPCEVQPDRLAAGAHQVGNSTFMQYGLSLRDYFAAKAMQGLAVFLVQNIPGWSRPANEQEIAEQAYAAADAMLAAREAAE